MRAAAPLRRHPWTAALVAVGLLLAVLHLAALGTAPPGLYADEASIGYNAWAVAHAGIDVGLGFETQRQIRSPRIGRRS